MSDNATSVISRYLSPDSNSLRKHGNAGEEDGSKNLPRTDIKSYSTYEQTIINDVQGAWNKYLEVKGSESASQQQKLEANKQEIQEKIIAQQDQFEVQKTGEINNILQSSGPNSADRASLQKKTDEHQETFNEIRTLLSRPVETHYTKVYLLLLIGLSFAELGINRVAFTYHFGDGTMATILALAVGVIFLFFAHTTGKILKESTCAERKPNLPRSYIACSVITIIMLALMYFIAVIRQKLAAAQAAGGQEFSQLLGEPIKLETLFNTPLGEEGVFMMLLNIAVFAVGISASFYRHDPHPSYERAEKKYQKARNKLEKHIKNHETAVTNITKEFDKKIAFQTSLTNQREAENSSLVKALEKAEHDKNSVRESLANSLNQMLLSYYRGNESTRSTPSPAHFSEQSPRKLKQFFQ